MVDRETFNLALKRSRCPKDNGHVLEVSMPDVICEKCSTTYILAIQSGTFFMRSKLIEKQSVQLPSRPTEIIREKEVIQRDIVKVPCKFCGNLNDLATTRFCPSCGAAGK
jgi:hypothetical protein